MSVELIILVFVLAAFSLYGVLSGIELGVALMRVESRLAPAKPSNKVFTPRWEVTNILLALGCVGLATRFPEAADLVVRSTWPVLVVGILALVTRAALFSYMVVQKTAPGGKLNYLFAATSLIVPVCLGTAGIYMVTGEPFWQTGAGLTLFVSLVVGLAALGASFIYYVGGKEAPQGVVLTSRVLNICLAALLGLVMLVVLSNGDSHLFNLSYSYLAVIAAGVVLMQSVFVAAGKEWRMWWCLVSVAALAPFLVGLANYPYLIYPDVLIGAIFAI